MIDLIKKYSFDQLDWQAQDRAIDNFAAINYLDYDWQEYILDDIAKIADCLGIKSEGNFHFDEYDFSFEGQIYYKHDINYRDRLATAGLAVTGDLAELVTTFETGFKKLTQILSASEINIAVYTCNYCHCSSFLDYVEYYSDLLEEWYEDYGDEVKAIAKDLIDAFTSYAHRLLMREYDYLTSREYIEETIRINDYKFDANGVLA